MAPPEDTSATTTAAAATTVKVDDTTVKTAAVEEGKQVICDNYINGRFVPPSSGSYLDVTSPTTGNVIGRVALSQKGDVDKAVDAAKDAFGHWSQTLTMKSRASIMLKFHSLVTQHATELATLIVRENGKNMTEALADVAKGNETVEYACSLPQLAQGHTLRVSREVHCQDRRDPLGVVTSIVPFNFPFMVPMWTVPIALVLGNCVILKPSEKVPLTMHRVVSLFEEAGLPKGVFQIIHGTAAAVERLIDHPDIRAVTFVGSSPVAEIVSSRCRALNKKCTALGGAKNHLVALDDCDVEQASTDIVVSYAGCAGQRCMAASVLLLVGEGEKQKKLLDRVIAKASQIPRGTDPGCLGPVIDGRSQDKILKYIAESESRDGATILLDGRSWNGTNAAEGGGCWIGPTILQHKNATDPAMTEEVFGPVLSVYTVKTWEEAIDIENTNPFGNAACVYTTSGGNADYFVTRFRAAMLGVNIGIPVPREPFSFGGLYGTRSKFGDADITGDGAMEFFTNRIKVTSKWPVVGGMSLATKPGGETATEDRANFAGRM